MKEEARLTRRSSRDKRLLKVRARSSSSLFRALISFPSRKIVSKTNGFLLESFSRRRSDEGSSLISRVEITARARRAYEFRYRPLSRAMNIFSPDNRRARMRLISRKSDVQFRSPGRHALFSPRDTPLRCIYRRLFHDRAAALWERNGRQRDFHSYVPKKKLLPSPAAAAPIQSRCIFSITVQRRWKTRSRPTHTHARLLLSLSSLFYTPECEAR